MDNRRNSQLSFKLTHYRQRDEAFELVYEFAKIEADWDVKGSTGEGHISGFYHVPRWLAVSLDIFGFNYLP